MNVKMKKTAVFGLAFLLVLVLFTGCSAKVAGELTEKDVTAAAEELLFKFRSGQWEQAADLFTEESGFSGSKLYERCRNNVWSKTGEYVETESTRVFGSGASAESSQFVTCVMLCAHEKGTVEYTFTFNLDLEATDFSVKKVDAAPAS
ncbi:MAG: hypothetical protein E7223_02095 [Clostridiales bacterium]|nr:hypothetical protein [Clostridiales bacterium]